MSEHLPAPGEQVWTPPADVRETSQVGRFLTWLDAERGVRLESYDELWRWSVDDLEGFWAAVWDFFALRASAPYERVLDSRDMPGARWFPGARLNYAEHAVGRPEDADRVALLGRSQNRPDVDLTFNELREEVARARAGLQRLGVGPGDRVVAYLPNIPETVVAFLATASLGAVWSSCAPELGARSMVDRFGQVEPTVLLAVAGYRYGTRTSTAPSTSRRSAPDCRPCARSSTSRTSGRPSRTPCPGPICWPSPASWPSSRCRPTTPCSCCSPRARPASRRRSCTGTAASSSSTSRTTG